MSEFVDDEQRDAYVAGLVEELDVARLRRPDDAKAIEAELKRLGGKKPPAPKPARGEHGGEFGSAEHRAAHIAALEDELRGYEGLAAEGDSEEAKALGREGVVAVKAELKRLGGKPAKTLAELDAEAAKAEAAAVA